MTLYKTVPVTEDNLPKDNGEHFTILADGNKSVNYFYKSLNMFNSNTSIEPNVTHYLLPVGEEKLRRLCEEVRKKVMEANYEYGIGKTKNPKTSTDTAITSLIDKFLKDEL